MAPVTHSGLQELLPLKWLSLLPIEVKGQAKPLLHSVTGLLSPGSKREKEEQNISDVIWCSSKTQSLLWSPHPRPLVSEIPNSWIDCVCSHRTAGEYRELAAGSSEESRPISLSQECRGLTMEGCLSERLN